MENSYKFKTVAGLAVAALLVALAAIFYQQQKISELRATPSEFVSRDTVEQSSDNNSATPQTESSKTKTFKTSFNIRGFEYWITQKDILEIEDAVLSNGRVSDGLDQLIKRQPKITNPKKEINVKLFSYDTSRGSADYRILFFGNSVDNSGGLDYFIGRYDAKTSKTYLHFLFDERISNSNCGILGEISAKHIIYRCGGGDGPDGWYEITLLNMESGEKRKLKSCSSGYDEENEVSIERCDLDILNVGY